jgi:NodT family efflux transporter outer membrane factor (OMF) lipoprotein
MSRPSRASISCPPREEAPLRRLRPALLGMLALGLASCASVGPDYQRPTTATPAAYKEQGPWKPSQPQDAFDRGSWWELYRDPVLNGLEARIAISNQNLKAAEASYREAAALVDEARAGYYPTASASASASRNGRGGGSFSGAPSGEQVSNQFNLTASASWSLDLWGRIRRMVESSVASAQASAADLASAQLSAQATLASDYIALRAADALRRLLDATASDDQRALNITRNQYSAGVASAADVAQAQTQYLSVQSQAISVAAQRATLEHAIAVLIGSMPSSFGLPEDSTELGLPELPLVVPSSLLQRRPDISGAERRMAAANAQIGVAISAYYPDLSLSASFGYQGSMLDTLLHAANEVWSVGPALAETLFDGGLRSAQTAAARAAYDAEVATYRQTVLSAFQEVEDALATLRILQNQVLVQDQATVAAKKSVTLVMNQYQAGTVAYTSVITVQAIELSNEESALNIRSSLFTASVNLIQALGGGWNERMLPQAKSIDHDHGAPASGGR